MKSVLVRFTFWIVCICYCQVALAAAAVATSSASLPLWKTLVSRFHPRKLQLKRRLTKCSDDNVKINPSKSTPSPCEIDSAAAPFFSSSLNKESEETASSDTVLRDYLPPRRRQELLSRKLRDWWDNLPPRFHEPRTWGRWMASGVQIGLVVYLVHAVFKAASEVLDEYYATSTEQSGLDPAVFSRDHVMYAIERLQRAQSDPSATTVVRRGDDKSMAALSIAQRLALVGLPLLRQAPSSSSSSSLSSQDHQQRNRQHNAGERPSVESILMSLSRSEANLLQECLWLPPRHETPLHLWERVTGLERCKRGLSSALATVQRQTPHAYASLFDTSSTGVLLYGPPGCGKTMVAMAVSAMARIPCLLVTPSVLLRKYVGETNQQCRTLFSLAQKLSPCIICIDELDGLFRKRSENEHEVSRDLKTEFLQHWEGMLSRSSRNLVVAATNRPFDVDEAVLRRFTQSHLVGLPDVNARTRFLHRLLHEIPTAPDVDVSELAASTEGYSPSDLRRLLQTAASMGPLRESLSQPRPLTKEDIQHAMQIVPPTPLSPSYRESLTHFIRSNQPSADSVPPLHPRHQQQQPHMLSGHEGGSLRWETEWGNFYHLGSLQVDAPTFEILSNIMERLSDMADEYSDYEDDDENLNQDEDKDT